nr:MULTISPECIES: histidine kinase [Brevibacterium]
MLQVIVDLIVGSVIYAIGALTSWMALTANPLAFDDAGELTVLGVVFALLVGVLWLSVFVRRRWPLVPFVIGAVLSAAWCDSLLLLIGMFHLIVRAPRRQAVTCAVIGSALVVAGVLRICLQSAALNPFGLLYLSDPNQIPAVEASIPSEDSLFGMVVVTVLAGVIGLVVSIGAGFLIRRTRRMKAIETVAERETKKNESLTAELARRAERELLARELHDTLSHRLSVISLHSGALELGGRSADEVAATASAMRQEAHASLEDLRHIVGGVREGTLETERSRPNPPVHPSMKSIPQLIASVQATGTAVHPTVIMQDVESAPSVLDQAVYRIVQEALTNAMKHAHGAPVELDVAVSADQGARVLVTNPIDAHPRVDEDSELGSTGMGAGLEGMRERARMLDGSAEIGPQGHEFIVDVRFPPFPRRTDLIGQTDR